MKKLLVLALFGLLSSQLWGKLHQLSSANEINKKNVYIVTQSASLKIKYALSQFESQESSHSGFKKLIFGDLKKTSLAGHPQLPYHSFLVAAHRDELRVEMNLGAKKSFKNLRPIPAQQMPCRSCGPKKTFDFNLDAYKNSKTSFYRLESLGDFRGTPLTRVVTFPAYYSQNEGVVVYPHAQFQLTHIEGEKIEIFSQAQQTSSKRSPHYLIATPAKYISALDQFVDWKKAQGFKVDIVSLEEMGEGLERVRDYFYRRYHNTATKFDYALIVGDEDSFPTHYVETRFDRRTPSDLYYFLMGEEGDEVPDVYYGRLVVSDREDIEGQVNKLMAYEKGARRDGSGYRRMLGIASDEGMDPTDVEYMQQMLGPFAKKGGEVHYFFQQNSNSSPENVNAVLDSGVGWMNYIGHGVGPAWTSLRQGDYTTRDVASLKAGKVKPIIIDVACQNGRFSLDDRLGERFMNAKDAGGHPIGAVAYYGGSVDISWYPPAVMAVGITKAVMKESFSSLGEVIMAGQMHLLATYDDREAAVENLKWYHLLGDPSLQLRFEN